LTRRDGRHEANRTISSASSTATSVAVGGPPMRRQ
jgi:hypothetical protein